MGVLIMCSLTLRAFSLLGPAWAFCLLHEQATKLIANVLPVAGSMVRLKLLDFGATALVFATSAGMMAQFAAASFRAPRAEPVASGATHASLCLAALCGLAALRGYTHVIFDSDQFVAEGACVSFALMVLIVYAAVFVPMAYPLTYGPGWGTVGVGASCLSNFTFGVLATFFYDVLLPFCARALWGGVGGETGDLRPFAVEVFSLCSPYCALLSRAPPSMPRRLDGARVGPFVELAAEQQQADGGGGRQPEARGRPVLKVCDCP